MPRLRRVDPELARPVDLLHPPAPGPGRPPPPAVVAMAHLGLRPSPGLRLVPSSRPASPRRFGVRVRVRAATPGGAGEADAVVTALAKQVEESRAAANEAAQRAAKAEAQNEQLAEALAVADRARRAAVSEVTALLAKQRDAALSKVMDDQPPPKASDEEAEKDKPERKMETPIDQLPDDLPPREWKALLAAALDARDRALAQRDESKQVAFKATRQADVAVEQLVAARRLLAEVEGRTTADTDGGASFSKGGLDSAAALEALQAGAAAGEVDTVLDQLIAAEGGPPTSPGTVAADAPSSGDDAPQLPSGADEASGVPWRLG